MNDKYLWDRTGEPDPEIQQLEELLGTLRYQPRPLEIPENLSVARKRSFYLPVSIAAAIIIAAILLGLWFQFGRTSNAPKFEARHDNAVPSPANVNNSSPEPKSTVVKDETPEVKPRPELNRNVLAVYRRPVHKRQAVEPQLTPQQEADKEQVLFALRLVSAKLNLVQRRTTTTPNIIRNQHKIG